jgi:hypothetical protein
MVFSPSTINSNLLLVTFLQKCYPVSLFLSSPEYPFQVPFMPQLTNHLHNAYLGYDFLNISAFESRNIHLSTTRTKTKAQRYRQRPATPPGPPEPPPNSVEKGITLPAVGSGGT